MTEREFQHNLSGAQALAQYDHDNAEFWTGYQRGIQRKHYGTRFGTPEEHKLWMSLADDPHDTMRRDRGRGYRAGFAGQPIAAAIKAVSTQQYRSELGRLGGSATSERKTAAVRKNAKLGGRPKPTELTEKQRQALDLRQAGKSTAEIAQEMQTTREPVRQWIAAARRKLGIGPE